MCVHSMRPSFDLVFEWPINASQFYSAQVLAAFSSLVTFRELFYIGSLIMLLLMGMCRGVVADEVDVT